MHAARPVRRKFEPSATRAPGNRVTGRRSLAGSARPADLDGRSTTSGTGHLCPRGFVQVGWHTRPAIWAGPGRVPCVVNRTINNIATAVHQPGSGPFLPQPEVHRAPPMSNADGGPLVPEPAVRAGALIVSLTLIG